MNYSFYNKTMADKFMCFPNDDKQNQPFCRFKISGWNVLTLKVKNQPIEIPYSPKSF